MNKKYFANDKKEESELTTFKCTCGLGVEIDLAGGPHKVEWTCPDLECQRMFSFEYEGKRRESESELKPDLRLVENAG